MNELRKKLEELEYDQQMAWPKLINLPDKVFAIIEPELTRLRKIEEMAKWAIEAWNVEIEFSDDEIYRDTETRQIFAHALLELEGLLYPIPLVFPTPRR